MDWLLNAGVHWLGTTITYREIAGDVLGLASAALALRRRLSAWPVGMIANVILFTIFVGGVFRTPQDRDLYGQAGRQVFFFVVSVYGWHRWYRTAHGDRPAATAVQPRWATSRERWWALGLAGAGVLVFAGVLSQLGSFGPWSDAWILTGSLLATWGMARGLLEFWLVWIAVDAVGVPLLVDAHFYPSALLYGIYALFCAYGFVGWLRLRQPDDREPVPAAAVVGTAG